VDDRAHAGDQDHHDRRESINQHADPKDGVVGIVNWPDGDMEGALGTHHIQGPQGEDTCDGRGEDSYRGHIRGKTFAPDTDEKGGE